MTLRWDYWPLEETLEYTVHDLRLSHAMVYLSLVGRSSFARGTLGMRRGTERTLWGLVGYRYLWWIDPEDIMEGV